MRCKRCGDIGHQARSCDMPRTRTPRPDIESMTAKIASAERKMTSVRHVLDAYDYIAEVEQHRRILIRMFRRHGVQLPSNIQGG